MTKEQILNELALLSITESFYARLWNDIKDDELFLNILEMQKFPDIVCVVLFIQ